MPEPGHPNQTNHRIFCYPPYHHGWLLAQTARLTAGSGDKTCFPLRPPVAFNCLCCFIIADVFLTSVSFLSSDAELGLIPPFFLKLNARWMLHVNQDKQTVNNLNLPNCLLQLKLTRLIYRRQQPLMFPSVWNSNDKRNHNKGNFDFFEGEFPDVSSDVFLAEKNRPTLLDFNPGMTSETTFNCLLLSS